MVRHASDDEPVPCDCESRESCRVATGSCRRDVSTPGTHRYDGAWAEQSYALRCWRGGELASHRRCTGAEATVAPAPTEATRNAYPADGGDPQGRRSAGQVHRDGPAVAEVHAWRFLRREQRDPPARGSEHVVLRGGHPQPLGTSSPRGEKDGGRRAAEGR